ncbi:MAG: hypothetical protein V3U75_13790 [Methylococcaceae bacterium]
MNEFNNLTFYHDNFNKKVVIVLASLLLAWVSFTQEANALEIECEIPLAIVCEVSDPNGFMSVRVNVDFGDLGLIDVVSRNFPTCRTSTTVSWDPIVANAQIIASPCPSGQGGDFTFDNNREDSTPVVGQSFTINSDIQTNNGRLRESSSIMSTQRFEIVADKLSTNEGEVAAVKFCDNNKVDDDIVACDIDEIAWVCPDDATGPSQACDANVHGEFDD